MERKKTNDDNIRAANASNRAAKSRRADDADGRVASGSQRSTRAGPQDDDGVVDVSLGQKSSAARRAAEDAPAPAVQPDKKKTAFGYFFGKKESVKPPSSAPNKPGPAPGG